MVKESSHLEKTPETSGMVKHHYAPNTPMFSLDDLNKLDDLSNCGFIGFDSINSNFNTAHQFILSNNGDLDIAASELYRSFHVMDAREFERLFIEWLPEKGIGRAINDRIKRAIQKTKT